MHSKSPNPFDEQGLLAGGTTAKTPARAQALDPQAVRRHRRRLGGAEASPWLHEEVARRMAERLSYIKMQPQRILQWSPFLGGGSAELAQAYPQAQQVLVESEPELQARSTALHKKPWWQAWKSAAAAKVLSPQELAGQQFQLLWANMDLHSHSDLPQILSLWNASLDVDGFVMFSCLGPDSFVELRRIFETRAWGRAGPEWWDMHDIGDLLVQAGFGDPVMDQERIQLTWADPKSLLKDLRALGGNIAPARFAGCRGKTWHQELLQALESLRAADGRLKLSVEIVYGHAFKPPPRLRVSAETSVTLDQMRAMLRKTS